MGMALRIRTLYVGRCLVVCMSKCRTSTTVHAQAAKAGKGPPGQEGPSQPQLFVHGCRQASKKSATSVPLSTIGLPAFQARESQAIADERFCESTTSRSSPPGGHKK